MQEHMGTETADEHTLASPCAQASLSTSAKLFSEARRRILHFTPAWFSINMGTGIASILLYNLPFQVKALQYIAMGIFILNILLFVLFLATTIARYLIWPRIFPLMLSHPTQSLFLGTLPMGLATIINMIVFVCVPRFGDHFATLAWVLWWIDAALSMIIGTFVPYIMVDRHKHTLETMTAVWLLPIVANVVAAASGGVVASVLPPQEARITVITSYIIWGAGVPISFMIIPIYLQRLFLFKNPPSDQLVSVFLVVGPCGQGAYGLSILGKVVSSLATDHGVYLFPALTSDKQILQTLSLVWNFASLIAALIMWGIGLFWLILAVTTIIHRALTGGFKFNLGWWGFTFPIGVWAAATNELGNEMESTPFKILGTIISACVIFFWIFVSSRTAYRAWIGTLFYAPCLGSKGEPPTSRCTSNIITESHELETA